jgi:hypothetical protein
VASSTLFPLTTGTEATSATKQHSTKAPSIFYLCFQNCRLTLCCLLACLLSYFISKPPYNHYCLKAKRNPLNSFELQTPEIFKLQIQQFGKKEKKEEEKTIHSILRIKWMPLSDLTGPLISPISKANLIKMYAFKNVFLNIFLNMYLYIIKLQS